MGKTVEERLELAEAKLNLLYENVAALAAERSEMGARIDVQLTDRLNEVDAVESFLRRGGGHADLEEFNKLRDELEEEVFSAMLTLQLGCEHLLKKILAD